MQVHSIFESISGEAGFIPQGTWCTFIRLQGCNLRCNYCDTKDALDPKEGEDIKIIDIANKVHSFGNKYILITGGEPILQVKEVRKLIYKLVGKQDYFIQIETNGSCGLAELIGIPNVYIGFVMDYKCPSSGMQDQMMDIHEFVKQSNITSLMVKFVVMNDSDMDFAMITIGNMIREGYKGKFILSPVNADSEIMNQIIRQASRPNAFTIETIKENPNLLDRVIFSLQLHKILKLA